MGQRKFNLLKQYHEENGGGDGGGDAGGGDGDSEGVEERTGFSFLRGAGLNLRRQPLKLTAPKYQKDA